MSRFRRALALLVLLAALATSTTATTAQPTYFAARPTACASGTGAAALNKRFAAGIGPVIGMDYQRTFRLPDRRVLWVFQDAFIRTPSGATRLVHNIGLVQSGRCFRLLRAGTAAHPRSWIGARSTAPERHWFWPLGGTVAADGTFRLFLAEMVERGPRYLSKSQPVATWMATIDLPSLRVVRLRRAPDPSSQLYGWSVVNGSAYTYLFGHCHRQFGWGFLGHHPCAAKVTVARVPRGKLGSQPTYWNGSGWTSRRASAVNIAPRRGPNGEARTVNPMQFSRNGTCWVAVTKVGDWFGDSIYLDVAPSPVGRWRTAAVIPARTLGPRNVYNTYFASFIKRTSTSRIVGISNNRWDGRLSPAYRPTFTAIESRRWKCGTI
jgi:hypothetical protein